VALVPAPARNSVVAQSSPVPVEQAPDPRADVHLKVVLGDHALVGDNELVLLLFMHVSSGCGQF
jgi:hypothetical protein